MECFSGWLWPGHCHAKEWQKVKVRKRLIEIDHSLQLGQKVKICETILPRILRRARRRLGSDCLCRIAAVEFTFLQISEDYFSYFLLLLPSLFVPSNFSFHWLISWFVPFPHSIADFLRDFTWIFIGCWEKIAFASLFSRVWNLEYILLRIVRTAVLGLQTDFHFSRAILASYILSGRICFLVLILGIELLDYWVCSDFGMPLFPCWSKFLLNFGSHLPAIYPTELWDSRVYCSSFPFHTFSHTVGCFELLIR